ncbi:MAG: hydroxyacylglutathione hydrolase [Candidatus Latescibacterota bacterium]|jgi:hydroxyacylglutathione hydrolase
MTYTTLEDFLGDIVGKARRGQGMDASQISQNTGLSSAQIDQIESYALTPDDGVMRSLATALNLHGEKLIAIAKGWVPEAPNDSFENDQMRVERLILDAGMTVNCYVMVCKNTGKGAVIDPGGQANIILGLIQDIEITHILLTHGHGDHVGALEEIAKSTDAVVCGCERDFGLMGGKSRLVTERVDEGWQTRVGDVEVHTFGLAGHTPGGIGYYAPPVFFSGDALFAGSLGGARGEAYSGQIRAVESKVLSLPDETHILPGHGPVTTVGQEKMHNPYFI